MKFQAFHVPLKLQNYLQLESHIYSKLLNTSAVKVSQLARLALDSSLQNYLQQAKNQAITLLQILELRINTPNELKRLEQFVQLFVLHFQVFKQKQLTSNVVNKIVVKVENQVKSSLKQYTKFKQSQRLIEQLICPHSLHQLFQIFQLLREAILRQAGSARPSMKPKLMGVDDFINVLLIFTKKKFAQHVKLSQFLRAVIGNFEREGKFESYFGLMMIYAFHLR